MIVRSYLYFSGVRFFAPLSYVGRNHGLLRCLMSTGEISASSRRDMSTRDGMARTTAGRIRFTIIFTIVVSTHILNFFIRKIVNINKNAFYLDFLRHFSRLHFSLVQVPLVAKWNVRSDWRESGTWRYKQNRDQSIALLVVQSVGEIHLLDWDRGWPRHICCFVRRKNRRN